MEATTLASRSVGLAGGGISQVGAPLELYDRPANEFVAQFIGSPAMNLLPGEVVETGPRTQVRLDGGEGVIASDYPTEAGDKGRKVNVGIRPEDMEPVDGDAYAFAGTVEISESLGEVTVLYFDSPEGKQEQVIAKLQGTHNGLRGKTLRLGADPAKVHLFMDGRSLLYR